MKNRTKIFFTGLVMAGLVFLGIGSEALAQNEGDTFGIKPIDNTISLGGGDVREIAARFINIALGLLGIITVGLILYGGFLYMTAGGNEDKVAEGKKYIVNAVIGLVIIFSAWAIVQFVFKQLGDAIIGNTDVTNNDDENPPGPDSCEQGNEGDCDRFCDQNPGASICQEREFYVRSINPGSIDNDRVVTDMNNITVRVLFSRPLAAGSDVSKAVTIQKNGTGGPLPLQISLAENNRVLEVKYLENGATTNFRIDSSVPYVVTVNPDLKDSSGKSLKTVYAPLGKAPTNVQYFIVNEDRNDATKPFLAPITLNGTSGETLTFAKNSNLTISSYIDDRETVAYGGNGLVKIGISETGGQNIVTAYTAPLPEEGSTKRYNFDYTTKLSGKFNVGQKYTVTITGYDIDGNVQTTSANFRVIASHCENGTKDGDETGVDSGGSCGAGDGEACTQNSDCATGYQCIDNKCTPGPVITDLDPGNGAPGNWITINGKNFGTKTGKVYFGLDNNKDGKYTDSEWVEATIVNCGSGVSWNPNWIVVAVPGPNADFSTGVKTPIKVVLGDGVKFDTTIDDFGAKPNSDGLFVINTIQRPGLCKVGVTNDTDVKLGGVNITLPAGNPAALPDVPVTAKGSGFGTKNEASRLVFGAYKNPSTGELSGGFPAAIEGNNWTDLYINSKVPTNLKAGNYAVHVTSGGETSNGVKFAILSADKAEIVPVISSIDPTSTTRLSLITIAGRGFGNEIGQVYLYPADRPFNPISACLGNNIDSDCKLLNVDSLPNQCGDTWTDTQIVGQIPNSVQEGKMAVIVKNSSGFNSSGQDTFEIAHGDPRPSICRISPSSGPAPLPVGAVPLTIYGFNFSQTNPTLYYWQNGADPNNVNTWLDSTRDRDAGNFFPVKEVTIQSIKTTLPIGLATGRSMSTGPIKYRDFQSKLFSNGVTYTVDSCVNSKTALPGYHCCSEGPDSGQWKTNAQSCQGETRDASYLWRFTTGILTYQPKVVEECNPNTTAFPSPTPRARGTGLVVNNAACVNSSVAVRFTEGMDETTLTANNVKVFECGTKDGQIDCATKKDAMPVSLSYQSAGKTLIIKQAPPVLSGNTWYQVELSSALKSKKETTFLGQPKTVTSPILITRPCGTGTAYCFTFKTGTAECSLADAGINPPEYTARTLGVIQDPRYPFSTASLYLPTQDNPPNNVPPFPNYFYVWGKGNQDCSVLNVDQYPWVWTPGLTGTHSDEASAFKSVKAASDTALPYLNSRAIVAARAHTAPNTVPIKAEVTISNVTGGAPGSNQGTDSIGGTDVLAKAQITVPADGYAPGQSVGLNAETSSLLTLQSSFTLQIKYSKSPSLTNANLLERRNVAVPRIGYRIYIVGSAVCFSTYSSAATAPDVQHCFSPKINTNGIYNVALSWDQNSKKLNWIDLNNFANKFEKQVNTIPLSSENNAILVGNRVPSTDPGPSYHQINYLNSVLDLSVKTSSSFAPVSQLTIDLADPAVTYYEPNCVESCVNTRIRADFNRQMDEAGYAAGFKVYKCNDGVACQSAVQIGQYAIDAEASNSISLQANLNPGSVLDQNTYYKVSLNGSGTNGAIKTLVSDDPKKTGKSLPTTEWIFKTKNDGTPCKVSSLVVVPILHTATEVGEQTQFTVVPYSAPNACSKVGQALNKWDYQYSWSTQNPNIAKISNLKPASYANIPSFCTNFCLKKGSTISSAPGVADLPMCGNGKKDAGEDCDIAASGEVPGTSCSLACLRPGNTNTFNAQNTGDNVCGNGKVETEAGEQCDPGNKDGKIKSDVLGCTDKCLYSGSTTGNTAVGVANCGDTFVTAGQETCDLNDPGTKNGCTAQCLQAGTKLANYWCEQNRTTFGSNPSCLTSVSVCGNGIVEPAEDCEVSGPNAAPNGACSNQCVYLDACLLPENKRPCKAGDPGCSNKCTLLGSKTTYTPPSVCGDKAKGVGENPSCELTATSVAPTSGPTQIVEAVGQGVVAEGKDYQETKIRVNTTADNKVVSTTADYHLQCGFIEFTQPISFSKFDSGVEGDAYNDCPNNYDNSMGVDAQSCCQPRPKRVSESPADASGFGGSPGVCRNALIEVEFNKEIRPETLTQNMFLVRGFGEINYDCTTSTVGGVDFTDYVKKTVAGLPGEQPGFWARLWQNVRNWFLSLWGGSATATTVTDYQQFKNIRTWCSVGLPVNIESRVLTKPNNNKVTVASLAISEALAPNSNYGVILRGDKGGITDVRGVPLGGRPEEDNFSRNDSWFFKTSDKICKLSGVLVDPGQYLFKQPASSAMFTAVGFTDTGLNTNKITSIPGLYAWNWSWLPETNPVFDFASQNPNNKLKVTAKNVNGDVTGIAQAKVIEDKTAENNQKDKIFSGTFELKAFFCETPWPNEANFPYKDTQYNFSTGYCADAGKAGDTTDDLPVLSAVPTSLSGIPGSTDTLKKLVFFNNKNDDAIGVQIFSSEAPLLEWYENKFGPATNMKAATVGGYRALTDGNNYYVQALNLTPGATDSPADDNVYSNIYLFGINPNATEETKSVFKKLIDNLQFNINVTNHGYCLKSGNPAGDIRTNPNLISNTQCRTDFNCRDAEGVPLAGTNGVCSNARTKFQRDWQRLSDVRMAQENLNNYFAAEKDNFDFKGKLAGGTFAPGYTVSKWGQSWGTLQALVGGLPSDPINEWTNCGTDDKQTCWNPTNTTYFCPKYASVYEYEYVKATNSYIFHAPLEFFTVNDTVTKAQIDISKFSASRWAGCDSLQYNPFSEKCGDGILNANEQCEPPGKVSYQSTYTTAGPEVKGLCSGWSIDFACKANQQCGETATLGNSSNDSFIAHVLERPSDVIGYCVTGPNQLPVFTDQASYRGATFNFSTTNFNALREGLIYTCRRDSECRDVNTYTLYDPITIYAGFTNLNEQTKYSFNDFKNSLFASHQSEFKCKPFGSNNRDVLSAKSCVGYQPAGTQVPQTCQAGTQVQVTCNNQCQKQYGTCQAVGSCGNGIVETGEACDDGALNGTYGHCNTAENGIPGCTGLASAGYCGNGKLDKDSNGNALEFCDASAPGSLFTANYNLSQSKSCSWDCQESGAYCGDGLVQSDKGEQCDDGNTKDGDACSASCKFTAIACQNKTTVSNAATLINNASGTAVVVKKNNVDVPECANLTLEQVCTGIGQSTGDGICDAAIGQAGGESLLSSSKYYPCGTSDPYRTKTVDQISDSSQEQITVFCNGTYQPPLPKDSEIPLSCGNGVTEKELDEECDAGANNDVKCVPQAGQKQCTYCGKGCKILTTDNTVYCGNGQVDAGEQCDFNSSQQIIAASGSGASSLCIPAKEQCVAACVGNTDCAAACQQKYGNCTSATFAPACADAGSYACSNNCTFLGSQCVTCGFYDKGALPQVKIVNPLIANSTKKFEEYYDTSYTASLFRSLETAQTNTSVQRQRMSSGQIKFADNSTYLNLRKINGTTGDADDLIQTSNQCSAKYNLVFNADKVGATSGGNLIPASATLKGSYFVFPTNNQKDKVQQQIFYSPAVPDGTFRVVLSWSDPKALFNGLVYNDETPGTGDVSAKEESAIDYIGAAESKTIIPNMQNLVNQLDNAPGYSTSICIDDFGQVRSEADNGGIICSEEEIEEGRAYWWDWVNKFIPPTLDICNTMDKNNNYWVPVGVGKKYFANKLPNSAYASYLCKEVNGIKITERLTTDSVKTIAYTIKPPTNSTKPFAFFIGEYNGDGLPAYRGGDLQVRVYEYRNGQDSLYSVYGPTNTFSIKNTGNTSTNANGAQYWHVFNLVKENGKYIVKKVPQSNSASNTQVFDDGMLQTSFCSTLNHIPGESCP